MLRHHLLPFVLLVCCCGLNAKTNDRVLSADSIAGSKGVDLSCCLSYSGVDDSANARVDSDESLWTPAKQTPDGEGLDIAEVWKGIGWFRVQFRAPQNQRPLALRIYTLGACEIFLDGKKIGSAGSIDDAVNGSVVPVNDIFPLDPYLNRSDKDCVHVIAFRVRTTLFPYMMNDSKAVAFSAWMNGTQEMFNNTIVRTTKWLRLLFIPLGIVIALGGLHLLLYFFDRRSAVNLLYVVFTAIFIGIFLCWHVQGSSTDPEIVAGSMWLINILWTLIIDVLVFLISILYYGHVSKYRVIAVLAISALVIGLPYIFGSIGTILWGTFATIVAIDVTRMTILAMKCRDEGAWIMGIGQLFFSLYVLSWFFGIYLNLLALPEFIWRPVFVMGLISMPLSMSVYLARRITRTNNDLRDQLKRVDELTAQKVAQERKSIEEEVRTKHLEEDNERKSHELEEARKLQFSMLPKSMPKSEHFESAFGMHTATEVGGDYVDYYVHADDHITFVIGDATGHGLKAGVMVATAKSHFQTHALTRTHDEIMEQTGSGIRGLNLKGLYMCLGLLTLKDKRCQWTVAGMPPLFHYNASAQTITQHLIKGLPLGAPHNGHAGSIAFDVEPNDIILLLTDGLPELFNPEKLSLGYAAIEDVLRASCDKTAQDIREDLITTADAWRKDQAYNDDVTVLVIKLI